MTFLATTEDQNIWISASDGDIAAVQQYMSQGVDVNAKDNNGYTPIHAAASYARMELLEYLVENGADVNIRDNDGDTPLHFCEEAAPLQWLLDHGADLALTNDEGKTIADVAVEEDREAVAVALGLDARLAEARALRDQINAGLDGHGPDFSAMVDDCDEDRPAAKRSRPT
eukprot:Rmarinus@m.17217